jgi:hypothetical protein
MRAVLSGVFTPNGKRALLASASALLLALAAAPAANAGALTLTINPPENQPFTSSTPEFSGTTSDEYTPPDALNPVTLNIYEGTAVGVEPALLKVTAEQRSFTTVWSATVIPGLRDGTYTAQAEQAEPEPSKVNAVSNAVTFNVDTAPPPHVAITYPASGSSASGESQLLTGSAATAARDKHEVEVQLFAGPTVAQPPLATVIVPTTGASWSAVFGALTPGTYTAVGLQHDVAGGTGTSAPVTFTLTASPPAPRRLPVASFSWFPPAPVVGQSVVLVSSSTDAAGPISAFAWDLAGNGPFRPAGPVLTTSFARAGNHVVRLQVTDALGGSNTVAETIPVSLPPLRPMQPFPIVRIAGVETATGVKLSLLSVQAPVGARVTVTCRGRGCRMKPQSRLATASKHARHASSVVLAFRRLERSFPAGATLEVRVSAAGELGKYTLFAIHSHRLPTRVDSCLSALDPQPVACST